MENDTNKRGKERETDTSVVDCFKTVNENRNDQSLIETT